MTDKEYNERIQVFDGVGDAPDTLLVYNHNTYMTVKGYTDDKVYSFWDPEPAVYVYGGGNDTSINLVLLRHLMTFKLLTFYPAIIPTTRLLRAPTEKIGSSIGTANIFR